MLLHRPALVFDVYRLLVDSAPHFGECSNEPFNTDTSPGTGLETADELSGLAISVYITISVCCFIRAPLQRRKK